MSRMVPPAFKTIARWVLAICAWTPLVASAYIDMPAEKLTLPRLLLEFRTSGVYRVDRFDPATGAIRYVLLETVQGNPPEIQKHILRMGGKIPDEITGIEVGHPAFLMGADPYGRGLAFINGAWYVTNCERDNGWWRIAYTSASFDFRCAFDGSVGQLVEDCKSLLDGEAVVVQCHPRAKSRQSAPYRVSLREPHKREPFTDPQTRPAAPRRDFGDSTTADLVASLASTDATARLGAVKSLAGRTSAADQLIPLLRTLLESDEDPFVRRQCAIALGRHGARARSAIPSLLDGFTQGYEHPRDLLGWECAAAIGRIDPAGDQWLAEIRRRFGSHEASTRRRAIEAIATMGPPARDAAVSIAIEGVSDVSSGVRYNAARALGLIRAPASQTVKAIAPLLADKDRDVPDAAMKTLIPLGAAATPDVARLLASSTDVNARRLAAQVLHDLGPAAMAAKDALVAARLDADAEVRALATKALQRLSGGR